MAQTLDSIENKRLNSDSRSRDLVYKLQELNIECESLYRPDGIIVTRLVSKEQVFEVHEYDDHWYAKCGTLDKNNVIYWPFVHFESDLDGPASFIKISHEFSGLSHNRIDEMIEFIRLWISFKTLSF